MRLDRLTDEGARVFGDGAVEIRGLASDSRAVRPGDLFAALEGVDADGREFVDAALEAGAAAVLGDPSLEERGIAAPLLIDPDPRRRLARIAATLSPRQPEKIAAVTGTNGKTSVVWFVRAFWRALGFADASAIGTLGVMGAIERSEGLTTPDPISLHRDLDALAERGCSRLAIEASSHGVAQRRLDGVRISAAAFTNISRDHLDYHVDFEAYFAAKARLFDTLLPEGAAMALNRGTTGHARLVEIAEHRRLRLVDYGAGARDFSIERVRPEGAGQSALLRARGIERLCSIPLIGAFQAENLLAAMALVWALEGEDDRLIVPMMDALETIEAPPGRMQLAARGPERRAIFVDYSHTPDSLAAALAALRPHVPGGLVVVFGCGGDRDPGKRPMMGSAAAQGADFVIVTDDNPRGESPAEIRAAALAGCPGGVEIGDRGRAILEGARRLGPGDALLIAGKGHERGQKLADRTLPFDDVEQARAAAAELGWRT